MTKQASKTTAAPSTFGLPCLCGCGEPTLTERAAFRPGHDAKLRAAVVRADLSADALPEVARPFFALGRPVAGLLLSEDGAWLTDTKRKPKTKLSLPEAEALVAKLRAEAKDEAAADES